jgi:hypothetical protein
MLRDRFGLAMGTFDGTQAQMGGGALTDWGARRAVQRPVNHPAFTMDYGPAAAAQRFLNASAQERAERLQFFGTQPGQNGELVSTITRQVDGVTRTLVIKWAAGHANWAANENVTSAEARAKTEWNLCHAVINAGFDANANSLTINGAWRPLRQAVRNRSSVRSPHIWGKGLDLTHVNNDLFNISSGQQTNLQRSFSLNLRNQGASQVLQPWMTFGAGLRVTRNRRVVPGTQFLLNIDAPGVEHDHMNHLHVSWPW